MKTILEQVAGIYKKHGSVLPILGIKLPPYFDFQHYAIVGDIINSYKHVVSYVVCINTVGNALAIDGRVTDAPYIASNTGFAGMSGPAVKHIALANVCKLRRVLDETIDIIGVGGIATGQDVYDMILVGARACQTATTHWIEGSGCFERMLYELQGIMKAKGYTDVSQFYNTLHPWSKDGANKLRAATKASGVASSAAAVTTDDGAMQWKLLAAVLSIIIAILLSQK